MIVESRQVKDFKIQISCPHCKKNVDVGVQIAGDKPKVEDVDYGIVGVTVNEGQN